MIDFTRPIYRLNWDCLDYNSEGHEWGCFAGVVTLIFEWLLMKAKEGG